jgi:hypothetical protein
MAYLQNFFSVKSALGKFLPMWAGQSTGFATKEGDQQYVNGTCKYSGSEAPIIVGTASRLSDFFLHELIISERLYEFVSIEDDRPCQ